jgi:hypothetical protein
MFLMGGQAALQDTSGIGFAGKGEAFEVYFNSFEYKSDKSTIAKFRSALNLSKINWLYEDGDDWVFDPSAFRKEVPDFEIPSWLQSSVFVSLDVEQYEDEFAGRRRRQARIFFEISKDDMTLQCKRLFLSHKSIDKELVRKIAHALQLSGYEPWLDENEMPAGSHLERSVSQAFKESLGSVFFITKSFSDAKYLASEIDYAIREKRERDEFAIIPIRLTDAEQANPPPVPDLLGTYVWKDVGTGLEAFIEIMKALKRR